MRQRTGHDESQGREEHSTTAVERGAFSHARCSCGWTGPARRARETSWADATAHSDSPYGSGEGGGDGADADNGRAGYGSTREDR
ncbi:hypothetical protein HCC61_29880 [Streptomyces sp. HNM0575]|uniref:hypothetical protein n=1 Tax=Streptomyces sp. HNM0575 TaxID=2716338 RepID=UPI00145D2883|nr:hypothetical protein [Streptomyces sp. HNM0575]